MVLWEKLGVCFGCDEDFFNVGSEDDFFLFWVGFGFGDEGDYDFVMNYVFIVGIEFVD